MVRSTTSGTLKSYRFNLQRSTHTLNQSRDTVLTQRKFNSFAEDPATAARAFQLRRSYLRTESQHAVSESVVRKYDVAWSTLESVVSEVNNQIDDSAFSAIVHAESDTSGAGRNALGQALSQKAESIIKTMNNRYGDNFVFSGADGLNIPFTWGTDEDGNRTLLYRGVDVNAKADSPEMAVLDYMVHDETKYADVGLGLQENETGEIISTSAANVALQGINYLGYGVDEDGDPKNIACQMSQMGEILQRCDPDSGAFASETDRETFYRLAEKFQKSAASLTDKHVELDTQASFLQTNQAQLETLSYTLNDQIVATEQVDLAEAITSYSWAQYCYNAALQTGNSILSQSLMDYLNK